MRVSDFNALRSREKWAIYKTLNNTKWLCPGCKSEIAPAPYRADPFHGAEIRCRGCDALLTRRTGGGQSDPFNWVLTIRD